MVYGRRRTGKTFLIKNFVKYDHYFFVSRDRMIYYKDDILNYDEFKRVLKLLDGRIVVDEFHRLGEEFIEYLHYLDKNNIILVTSTLWLSKRLLERKDSGLLGFSPVKIGLIDERDIMKYVNTIEDAVYLRESIL